MYNVILLNKLSGKLKRFCFVCFVLATRALAYFKYQSIYLEYESQIQQKPNNVGAEKKKLGYLFGHMERKVKTNVKV